MVEVMVGIFRSVLLDAQLELLAVCEPLDLDEGMAPLLMMKTPRHIKVWAHGMGVGLAAQDLGELLGAMTWIGSIDGCRMGLAH